MRRTRLALAIAGITLGLFGVFRLVTQVPGGSVAWVAVWLIAAVVIHDGIVSPLVLAVGAVVGRIPARARRFVQSGLVVAAIVTVIALPLIARHGTQPAAKAILQRNYAGNLTILLAVVATVSLLLYAVQVARGSGRRDSAAPSEQDLQ